jgi:hypothetical protein
MADLSNLFKVAPITASYMTGGQQAMDEQSQGLEQQRLQQLIQQMQIQNQQSQSMNPLLMEHQQLQNQTLGAKLPGIGLEQDAQRLKNQETAGTLESTIGAKNSDNLTKISGNELKNAEEINKSYTKYANVLEGIPEDMRFGVLKGLVGEKTSKTPMFQFLSTQVKSEDLPKVLKQMAEAALQENPQYRQAMDPAKERSASAAATNKTTLEAHRIDAASRERAASIYATSRAAGKGTPEFEAQMAKANGDPVKQLTLLYSEIAKLGPETPEGQALMKRAEAIQKLAAAKLNANPKPGGANLDSLGVESNKPLDIVPDSLKKKDSSAGTTKSGTKFKIIN